MLSRLEIAAIFAHLEDPWKLAALLMFGSGLRLMECLNLRAKDFDFDQGTITVHDGKGNKHRVVPLPRALEPTLHTYLASANEKHLQDLAVGCGRCSHAQGTAAQIIMNRPGAGAQSPLDFDL